MPEILKTKRNKSTKTKKQFSQPVNYLFSALKGLLFAFSTLGAVSLLLLNNGSFTAFYKAFAYIAIGLGAFICGVSAYRHIKGRGILNGVVGGAVYCGFIIVALLCIMRSDVSTNILYIVPISLLCSTAGGITGANF